MLVTHAADVTATMAAMAAMTDLVAASVIKSTIMNFNDYKSKISKIYLYSKWNVQIT